MLITILKVTMLVLIHRMVISVDACAPSPQPAGVIRSTERALYGTVVSYKCQPGYHFPGLHNSDTIDIECLQTLQWSGNVSSCQGNCIIFSYYFLQSFIPSQNVLSL